MKKTNILIFVGLILFQPSIFADEVHQLAKDVIHIVEHSPGGDPIADSEGKFHLTKEQSDQVVAYSNVNKEIVEHEKLKQTTGPKCPPKEKAKENLELKVDNSAEVTAAPIAPHVGLLLTAEVGYSTNQGGTNTSAAPAPVFSLPPYYLVYNQLLQSPKDWQSILAANKDKLSSDDKIALISTLGGAFSSHYNYARAADEKAPGFVNTEELLTSVATNKVGGICRDVSLAQTQMLEALGFKNNYSVVYQTFIGLHATTITTDPVTGKIVKFNYNEVTGERSGSGTGALAQNTTLADVGIQYKIYDTKGAPVVQVPSEIGQILSETAGGTDRELSAKNYNLSKVSFEKDGIAGSVFTGRTTSGVEIKGVAFYTKAESEHLKTHAGVSVSQADGNRGTVSVSASNIYGNFGAEAQSNPLKIGSAETRAIAGAEVGVIRVNANETFNISGTVIKGDPTFDASVEGFLGLKTEGKTKDGKTVLENSTYINIYPDYANVASVDNRVIAKNSVVVDTKLVRQLDNEDQSVLLRSAVIFRNYGASAIVEAGITDKGDRTRFLAGYRAPFSSDQPSFLPGGTSSEYVRAEKQLGKKITFTVEVEKSNSGTSARAGFEGKFN